MSIVITEVMDHKRALLIAFSTCWLTGASTIAAPAARLDTTVDAATVRVLRLYKDGKLDDAANAAQTAVRSKPGNWLRHATLSFMTWQQGDVIDAIAEGEKAAKLSGNNAIALANLAAMNEGLDDCGRAIPLYSLASKVSPKWWFPRVGLARCYSKLGKPAEANAVLRAMSVQKSDSLDWYRELADVYLQLNQPHAAALAYDKASMLAKTTSQKRDIATQRMLCLLMDNQVEQARSLKDFVFNECKPNDRELYVRAAESLIDATKPEVAVSLLGQAERSLKDIEDADGFYRLARVFSSKAQDVAKTDIKHDAWLNVAGDALRRAIALNPMQAKYYLALGSILLQQQNVTGATEQLQTAQRLDSYDPLTPYLLTRATGAKPFNLVAVDFRVHGLHCGCHVSRLNAALRKIDGVAFVDIKSKEPFEGVMLVDSSLASADALLEKGKQIAFDEMKMPIDGVGCIVVGTKPVSGVQQAVSIAQTANDGDAMHFAKYFKSVQPVLPIPETAQISLKTRTPIR